MRRNLCIIVVILFAVASAPASTIQNFVIVTASDMSLAGGTFNGGGTYSGTFSVDVSNLPTLTYLPVPLPAVDITITDSLGNSSTVTSGNIDFVLTGVYSGISLTEYSVGGGLFGMSFLEVPGTFVGGQIWSAGEGSLIDNSGDAVAVDPAALSPEPWTASPCGFGLLAVWWYRRRNLFSSIRG